MNKPFLIVTLFIAILLIASCGSGTGSTTTPTISTTTTAPATTTTTQATTTTPVNMTLDVTEGAPSAEELAEKGFMSPELPRITSEKLKQFMDQGESFILIDVRDGDKYNFKHLPQAISLPLNTVDEQIAGFLALPKDKLLIFY